MTNTPNTSVDDDALDTLLLAFASLYAEKDFEAAEVARMSIKAHIQEAVVAARVDELRGIQHTLY